MSTTITKRADELKPGDVVYFDAEGKCSFLYAERKAREETVRMQFGMYSGQGIVTLQLDPALNNTFKVESPTLSPAQQHADELAAMVLRMANMMRDGAPHLRDVEAEARALLAAIDPPAPPTLEEALKLLGQAIDVTPVHAQQLDKRILSLLDRARRAKIIP